MNYRTMLFIPGNNPGMLQNLDIMGADAIIIDLEDAVTITEKDAARILVKEYLSNFKPSIDIFIRINPLDSPYFYDDLEGVKDLEVTGILLPKASVESMKALDEFLNKTNSDFKVIALIETALGLEMSFDVLSQSDKVVGVLLGAEDLTLDLGAIRTKESKEIRYARSRIIAVSKALGIQAIDTPFTDTEDIEGLKMDTLDAKALGMTGKSLISPRHVDTVNDIFSPSKEEINHSLRVVEGVIEANKQGKGAFSLDGKMVDAPIIKRALNLLKLSGDYKEAYDDLLK